MTLMVDDSAVVVTTSETLRAALSAAGPGDVIRVARGVYREPLFVERGGKPGAPIRIEAEKPGSVIFSGADPLIGWRDQGDRRWSVPFESTAEERLRVHFGTIVCPCQVWVDDERLELVATRGDLRNNSFCLEGGQIWLQLPPDCDPNASRVEVARRGQMLKVPASHVEVRGLVVTRCASSVQLGGAEFTGSHLLIEDCEFSEAAGGIGAHFDGDDSIIRRCHIHNNGQMGFALVASRVVFEENLVQRNDLRGFVGHREAEWHVWECGGGKVAYAKDCVFRGNRFLDNIGGPGLWLDIDNYRNRIEGNWFSNNGHSAIMIEISRDNVIFNNIICDTRESNYSAAAILVQLSCRTRIYHNLILRSEGFGVHLRWHVRTRDIHPYEPADPDEFEKVHGFRQADWMAPDAQYPVAENDIRNNVFVDCRRGAIRIDGHPIHTRDNHSDYNFFWNAHNLHPMDGGHRLLEWQELTGLDKHSFYDRDMHYGPLLSEAGNDKLRLHPDGPLAAWRVPVLEEVPIDLNGNPRAVKTTPGPIEWEAAKS